MEKPAVRGFRFQRSDTVPAFVEKRAEALRVPPPPPLSEGALSLSLPEPLVFHHFLLAPFSAAGGEHECRVRVTVSDVGEERVWQEAMDDGERLG